MADSPSSNAGVSSSDTSASQSPLAGFGAGVGVGLGQGVVNAALTPLNVYLSERQMAQQVRAQKELTEHNAKVTAQLQKNRNLSQMSELVAGADRAGLSPLAAIGEGFNSTSAASAPMPSAATPQVQPPSILEASQARLLQAEAKKVENENMNTEGTWETLKINMPMWFRRLANETEDPADSAWYSNLADKIEKEGTTEGAFKAYVESALNLRPTAVKVLRDEAQYKLDYQILNNQLADEDVKKAMVALPKDQQAILWETARKLTSDIALNSAHISLSAAEASQYVAAAQKLLAEWAKITNSDYQTALKEGRIKDFLRIQGATLVQNLNDGVGNAVPVVAGAAMGPKGLVSAAANKVLQKGATKAANQTKIFNKAMKSGKSNSEKWAEHRAKYTDGKKAAQDWQAKQKKVNEKRNASMKTFADIY